MVYTLVIFLFLILLLIFDSLAIAPLTGIDFWFCLKWIALSFVLVIVVDALCAFIIRWVIPERKMNRIVKIYSASKKESNFYDCISIKKWKDSIPELGCFTKFSKNKILNPKDNIYLIRYILEANYGVLIHFYSIVFGFLIIIFLPQFWYCIGLPIALVNGFYNFLSLAILRYNLRKLHVLYKYNEKNLAK